MEISLEFEQKLIELYGSERAKNNCIEKKNCGLKENKKALQDSIHVSKDPEISETRTSVPSGFTLFLGIGIGVGLASHAVLTSS